MLFDDILEKLQNDGYLKLSLNGTYHLTFEGRRFKGYEKTEKRLFIIRLVKYILLPVIAGLLILLVWGYYEQWQNGKPSLKSQQIK